MNHILNLKPSPNDERDYVFHRHIVKQSDTIYPKNLDLRKDLMPVRDQGSQGTCYAQSAACMKEWQEKHNYNNNDYFSPQFFYNLRSNKYDNDSTNDEGMYGRDVMKLLKTYGICLEKNYPYGKIQHKESIAETIYESAKKNVIESYARINSINDLKMSLFLNGPAIVGFPVYNYGKQMWKRSNKDDSFKGGHAMTIVGYNDDGFIIRNSWGKNWGDAGYTIYYYNDWDSHWEIWSCVDKIDVLVPEPETVVEPVEPVEPVHIETLCEKFFKKLFN
jgi:C1A family cysteine protease